MIAEVPGHARMEGARGPVDGDGRCGELRDQYRPPLQPDLGVLEHRGGWQRAHVRTRRPGELRVSWWRALGRPGVQAGRDGLRPLCLRWEGRRLVIEQRERFRV